MVFFQRFYLDREKDIVVDLYMEGERLFHIIRTPNHHTGNLIRNLAGLCGLETSQGENGLLVIQNEIPCYYDGDNRKMYILRLGNTKVANIYPDGSVEQKASIPAISKTLMSQTKDYRLGEEKTIVKTYIQREMKFRTDLHTHMNGNLPPDILIALGIMHQIRYPYYYIKKLRLHCTDRQIAFLEAERSRAEEALTDQTLTGKYRQRRIDDLTFINFADLILGNPEFAAENIERIRNSLTVPKDGQAVFADLEKVYLYRYVFTKGVQTKHLLGGLNLELIGDREVRNYAGQIREDRRSDTYRQNTLYQDLLLWIAREYQKHGIEYVEITDTALLKPGEFPAKLREIHEIMPSVSRETGVCLRFLAGIRRIPLTIVRDNITPGDYLAENLNILSVIAADPYIAGSDIIGEEINDILELKEVIRELVKIAQEIPGFVIRIHAGENDSLKDNVANSIRCVAEAVRPERPYRPQVRIGHGLYTCELGSAKGKALLEEIRRNDVILEFQLSSNVRLNNLSSLENHPLRRYLKAGVRCVQGTDGGALYGTNSIEEELSLEKLLELSGDELQRMRQGEDAVRMQALWAFDEKMKSFQETFAGGDVERYYRERMENPALDLDNLWKDSGRVEAKNVLAAQIAPLSRECFPILIAGGSFNNTQHHTIVKPEDKRCIDRMLEFLDPERFCFVVGHTLCGQEGYLAKRAQGRFPVYAIVPSRITVSQKMRLQKSGVRILVSIESSGMGLYKSFAYEIFKRQPSVLLAFDGNSAAQNLIQEAKNGREKCRIFISPRSRGLAAKAKMLEGYVKPLADAEAILKELTDFLPIT
ncbi:MAG: adenosine deaminase [Blautia sp.]|nr:adenosine deaminase [Blautia sp.]